MRLRLLPNKLASNAYCLTSAHQLENFMYFTHTVYRSCFQEIKRLMISLQMYVACEYITTIVNALNRSLFSLAFSFYIGTCQTLVPNLYLP